MNIEQEIQNILDRNFTRGDNAKALEELLVLYNVVLNEAYIDLNPNVKIKHKNLGTYKLVKNENSEVELCDNPHCEDGIVNRDMYGHPIYCQVCNKHN